MVIPGEISAIVNKLRNARFKSYLVGGCVRDLLLSRVPKDWDIATDARPEEIQNLFPGSVYENEFGTVGVKTGSDDARLRIVEVTTFRKEDGYRDRRHPDSVRFADTIEEDLARRDFTVNAIAMQAANGRKHGTKNKAQKVKDNLLIIDPYNGLMDLKKKLIRAVGDPHERFTEDALRLVRAVRLAVELGFDLEKETFAAIKNRAGLLEFIAKERVRDELRKIIMAREAARGIVMLEDTDLLRYILPELREGIGCEQNRHHIFTVFDHNVRALGYAAKKGYSEEVRFASLLHDIGKPRTKRGMGAYSTFYNHEVVGARMAIRALDRLRFPREMVERVAHLIRCHMFYYNVGDVTEAGVRRFLRRVGPENVDDILKVREADRIGSNVPKAFPYKLRHLLYMIEKVKRDPLSPKALAIDGDDVKRLTGIPESPKIGMVLGVLLEEVLDDPGKNTREYLEKRAEELGKLPEDILRDMAEKARGKCQEFEVERDREIKKKYYIK